MTTQHLAKTEIKEKRMQDLLDSCQNQVLQQIIGPFGLTGAMFDDKDGGNVTTLKNFEAGITATQEDKVSNSEWRMSNNGGYTRKKYDAVKTTIRNDIKSKEEYLTSQYTGNTLHIDDVQLDHVVSVKTIETGSREHLFMNLDERIEMASQKDNLVASEAPINQSMGAKDPIEWAESQRKVDKGKTNAESFGVDGSLLKKTDSKAKSAIEADLLKAQIQKQGAELLSTGAKEAGKMAMRQAFGVLIHEFVKGVFTETKKLFKNLKDKNLIDELIAAIKRVAKRVMAKFKDAGKAALGGGIQGFFSNLLTFLINNIVKTSAKVVTIIRESIKSIWQAIKMMVNPPKHMSGLEITREVTKILTVAVVTGLGMFFEEALQGFIMTIPILTPIAGIVSPAIAAILTGITTALLVYGLDRFFDWLSDSGTQLLEAAENNLNVMKNNMENMALWINEQYNQSQSYVQIADGYGYIQREYSVAIETKKSSLKTSAEQIQSQISFNKNLSEDIDGLSSKETSVKALLNNYKLGE